MNKYGIYTKKVIKHFRNPHNYGKIDKPDGVGKAGNIYCGDVMYLYIKVGVGKKGKEIIEDIKFETYGCAAAIATSSVITDLVKGKTLKEAINIDKNKIVNSLGGLPPIKVHCSILATEGLIEAIYDYLSKNRKEIPEDLQKKHKQIQKSKEIIEKRYEKWTK